MKRSFIAGTAILAAGLLAQLALAPSASAGSQPDPVPPPTQCHNANCSTGLAALIALTGDKGSHGTVVTVSLPPPPCLPTVIGDQISGSKAIIWLAQHVHNLDPAPEAYQLEQQLKPFVQKAQQLLSAGKPDGNWYVMIPSTGDTNQQAALCDNGPLFYWVPNGAPAPPVPGVPNTYLAEYAFNHMTLPGPHVHASPANKGVVNLASSVWVNVPPGVLTHGPAHVIVARLGNQVVTVWAQPVGVKLAAPNVPAQVYDQQCIISSSAPGNSQPTGPGQPPIPRCGVLWKQTAQAATITATIHWRVTYYPNVPSGPHGAPVPGTTDGNVFTTGTIGFPVYSIQSVNNG